MSKLISKNKYSGPTSPSSPRTILKAISSIAIHSKTNKHSPNSLPKERWGNIIESGQLARKKLANQTPTSESSRAIINHSNASQVKKSQISIHGWLRVITINYCFDIDANNIYSDIIIYAIWALNNDHAN